MDAEYLLSGAEVADQIRRLLRGEVPLTFSPADVTWNGTYCGDVSMMIGEWKVVFFNDCDELDYCASAEAPDGREGCAQVWFDRNEEPTQLLTPAEFIELEQLLESAE